MIMPHQLGGETYLDTKETTELLGISRAKLNDLVLRGRLKRYKQGVRETPIYKEAEVRSLLDVKEDD